MASEQKSDGRLFDAIIAMSACAFALICWRSLDFSLFGTNRFWISVVVFLAVVLPWLWMALAVRSDPKPDRPNR